MFNKGNPIIVDGQVVHRFGTETIILTVKVTSSGKCPCRKFILFVDGSETPINNHLGCIKILVNNGINYQHQLVIAGFLNHQQVSHFRPWKSQLLFKLRSPQRQIAKELGQGLSFMQRLALACHLSHAKTLLLSIESWLFHRGSLWFFMVIPRKLGSIIPYYTLNNQVFFIAHL